MTCCSLFPSSASPSHPPQRTDVLLPLYTGRDTWVGFWDGLGAFRLRETPTLRSTAHPPPGVLGWVQGGCLLNNGWRAAENLHAMGLWQEWAPTNLLWICLEADIQAQHGSTTTHTSHLGKVLFAILPSCTAASPARQSCHLQAFPPFEKGDVHGPGSSSRDRQLLS